MDKSLKQIEIDIKNNQNDKSAPKNDRFVEVMIISFTDVFHFICCYIYSTKNALSNTPLPEIFMSPNTVSTHKISITSLLELKL